MLSTPLVRIDGKEDSSNDTSLELDSSGDEWKSDKEEMSETEDDEDKCTPCKKSKFPPKPNLILTPLPTQALVPVLLR